MKVLGFDLNTNLTGIAAVKIENSTIIKAHTIPAQSRPFIVSDHFSFAKSKKTMPTSKKGKDTHSTYYIPGELYVSKELKKERDKDVRHSRNAFLLGHQAKLMAQTIDIVKPEIILVERNEMFNGILTIELLAKLYGQLIGIAADRNIPYLSYNVTTIRNAYNVAKLSIKLRDAIGAEAFSLIKDKGKAAIAFHLKEQYPELNLSFDTFDESDALILIDYWMRFDNMRMPKRENV